MNLRRLFLGGTLAFILGLSVFNEQLNAALRSWRKSGCEVVSEIDAYDLKINPLNGDLWGTSQSGLFRFDGKDWQTYHVPSFQPEDVTEAFLVFDPQGRMWQGGHDGIGIFDGRNWTFYDNKNWGMPDTVVTSIAFDPTGKPWIGLSADIVAPQGTCGGLSVLDGDRWMTYHFSATSPMGFGCQNVQEIQFDPAGQLWVGMWNSTILRFEKTQDEKFQAAIPGGPVFSSSMHSTGYFLIPEELVLDKKDHGPIVIEEFYAKSRAYPVTDDDDRMVDEFHSITFDRGGTMWVNADDGLYRFRDDKFEFFHMPAARSVIDPQGNLWSVGPVVGLYNGKGWKTFQAGNSCIGEENVRSMAFDRNGRAWVALFPSYFENKFSMITFDKLPPRIPDLILRLRVIFFPPFLSWARWIGPLILVLAWLLIFLGAKWPAFTFPVLNIILALATERTQLGQYYSLYLFESLALFSLGGSLVDMITHPQRDERNFWKWVRPGLYGTVIGFLGLLIATFLWRIFGPSS